MRLSVLAGSGALVSAVVAAAREAGHKVQVLTLAPRSDLPGVKVVEADVANPLGILWSLKVFRTTHIVMAGAISLSDKTREALARFAAGNASANEKHQPSTGDATLSHLAISLERMTGAAVIGVQDVAPTLLAPAGHIAGPALSNEDVEGTEFALRAAAEIGRLDLGQAVVSCGRRLIAAEDIGGTDALLARVAVLRAAGLTGDSAAPLILAKAMKPGQPAFADLPAVGPDTIGNAAAAGIRVIGLEAGRCIVIDRATLVAAAETHGISVVGLSLPHG